MSLASPTSLVAFDLETTGVSSFLDVPVSYGFVERVVADGQPGLEEDGEFVNPGRPIPAGASAVHGIHDGDVVEGIELREATEMLAARLAAIWHHGGAIVGMNVSYDLTMVDSLCHRMALPGLRERGGIGPVLDVLIIDRHFDRYRKGQRRLANLCEHYGIPLVDAHRAVDDARASLLVYEAQARRYPELLAIGTAHINQTLATWHGEWFDGFNQWLTSHGKEPLEPGRRDWPLSRADVVDVDSGRS